MIGYDFEDSKTGETFRVEGFATTEEALAHFREMTQLGRVRDFWDAKVRELSAQSHPLK